ncbi:MAG TPA: 3-oxoacyl-ACP synthase, partial [Rhodoferax sp.]
MTLPSALQAPPLTVFVEGIGLLGPGLSNWAQGRGVLEGTETYQAARCIVPLPMALPAAERRRAGTVIKVALAVGQEAVTASSLQ